MLKNLLTTLTSRRLVIAAAWVLTVAVPIAAAGPSASVQYQRALAREKAARAATAPNPVTLRAIAKSYEAITRAHPTNGYADNALWQGAGVLMLAFERSGDRRDRDQAVRLLTWLKTEYPTAPLAKQVDAKLAALDTASPPAPKAAIAAVATTPTKSTPVKKAPSTGAASPAAVPAAAQPKSSPKSTAATSTPDPAGPIASMPIPKAPPTSVQSITYAKLPKGDRITLELTSEALYSTSRTSNPDRVTIDLVNSAAAPVVAERAAAISGTLLKSLSVAKGADDSTRLVLDVSGGPRYSTFPLYNPFRLVIDVESESIAVDTPTVAATSVFVAKPSPSMAPNVLADSTPAPVTPASTSRGDYSLARQLGLSVARIVIDPGHGGHDPGAQANGVTEAELVLDIALRLETLLKAQPDFDVVLTRRTDEFVQLEERTAIANRESADMFVSIHANASPLPAVRGIETFFLDFATTPAAEAVAARENASSAQTMRLLPELVKTIALNNKVDESRELARVIQVSMVRRLTGSNQAVRDLGVKRAPFVVLIGAAMPSVLAEVSFLTNKSDAGLLKGAAYRQRIAQALSDAVLKYRSSLKKVGTVAAN